MEKPEDIKAFCELAEKTAKAVSNNVKSYHNLEHVQLFEDGEVCVVFNDGFDPEDEVWVTVTLDQLNADNEHLLKERQDREAEANRLAAERLEKEKKEAAAKKEANDRKTYERLSKKYGPQ